MSVTLSIIKKDGNLSIADTLNAYINALEDLYLDSEMENSPQLYSEGKGVIGFVCETSGFEVSSVDTISSQKAQVAHRDLAIIKITHDNNSNSRKNVLEKVRALNLPPSPFIALEHTGLHYSDNSNQPPRLTKAGNIYLPVGNIARYFRETTKGDVGLRDTKGIEFAKTLKGASEADTINEYFSRSLDSGDFVALTDPNQSGMTHFTTLIHPQNNSLCLSFLQQKQSMTASYFLEPDTVFCSDACLLRVLRHQLYPSSQIKRGFEQVSIAVSQ